MKGGVRVAAVSAVVVLIWAQPGFTYRKIKCYVPVAPEIKLTGVRKVAVLDFEDKSSNSHYWKNDESIGRDIANKIIELLLQDKRGVVTEQGGMFTESFPGVTYYGDATTRVFDVVERTQLDQVLREQNLGQHGRIDDRQAAALGKVFGVQANIVGEYSVEVTEGQEGACAKRSVKLDATLKVQNVETGAVMGVKTATRLIADKICPGDTRRMATEAEITSEAVRFIASDLVTAIAPTFVKDEIELEQVQHKQLKKACEDAAETAESDPARAYPAFFAAHSSDPYNPELLFNLAAIHEATGDPEAARQFYQGASQLKTKKKYQERVASIEVLAASNAYLADMGHPVSATALDTAALNSGSLTKVVVKGTALDRADVYERADRTASVVASVPGGIQLQVLENSAEWYRVKLLGGKEGWLHVSAVKR